MTEEYKIDEAVKIPDPQSGRKFKYPWDKMQPGDSILVGIDDNTTSARSSAFKYAKKHGMIFISRSTSKGLRIWRTK